MQVLNLIFIFRELNKHKTLHKDKRYVKVRTTDPGLDPGSQILDPCLSIHLYLPVRLTVSLSLLL